MGLAETVGKCVQLELRGRTYIGLCPFHKDKTPSFHVNEERGFYHCFGCSAGGDLAKFERETKGGYITYSDAEVREARKKAKAWEDGKEQRFQDLRQDVRDWIGASGVKADRERAVRYAYEMLYDSTEGNDALSVMAHVALLCIEAADPCTPAPSCPPAGEDTGSWG